MPRDDGMVAAKEHFARLLQHFSDQAQELLEENGHIYHSDEQVIFSSFPAITARGLERALPKTQEERGETGDLKEFIYLKPVKEGALPLLRCYWRFDNARPECKFRVVLFKRLKGGASRNGNWAAWGFRIESPEAPGKEAPGGHENQVSRESRHGFWHIQMMSEFDKEEARVERVVESRAPWIPESDPAFPIAARDPTDALLILLVSLYGPTQVRDACRAIGWNPKALTNRLKEMISKY